MRSEVHLQTMINRIFENLSTAIVCLDSNLEILQINQAAESLLDISGTRSMGQKITSMLLNSDDLESVLVDSLDSGQTFTQRRAQFGLLSAETIMVDYSVTSVADRDGCDRDSSKVQLILELHPISRYLRIDRDELLRDHQEATRQMIRGLAHEIKNPLGGIRGSAQLLERQLPNEQLQEYTHVIIEEADRLTNLVDRMLGPNSLPQPSRANIHELLERITRLLEIESEGGLEIIRDYDPSIPEFYFDPELLTQALLNIGRNAYQALLDTHHPVITLATRIERQFTIGKIRHKLVLKVDIRDNGSGIPANMQEKLFFPMISGRPKGTGLGLSLAQSIVHQHDGTIEYQSRPGDTVFTVLIPIAQGPGCQNTTQEA